LGDAAQTMTKFKISKLRQEQKGWLEVLTDRVREGKILPFISNVISNDLLFGSHADLVAGWADYTEYPLPDKDDLARMCQYQSVMSKADPEIKADDVYIKNVYLDFLQKALFSVSDEELVDKLQGDTQFAEMSFSKVAQRLHVPQFDDGPSNPLLLLAELPLPIYLTTSYHTFMETALSLAGKQPRTEICYWDTQLKSIPSHLEAESSYRPSVEEPLVLHLHGLDAYARSLVLTEDDHLDFMVMISQDQGAMPLAVRRALADSSLLLLGYSLRGWDFRVLFRGMIKPSDNKRRPKSVFIQLQANDNEKTYLQNYLEQEAGLEVYWGEPADFMQKLWQAWSGE
jgi:hypothetical protein